MRKIICDRCGAEITGDRIGYVAAGWRAPSDNSFLNKNPYEHADFCEHYMNVIVACIDNVDISREEPEEPKEAESGSEDTGTEPEETKVVQRIQKASVKKPVDKGKVGALATAGWSMKKISDEMGVSPERIRQILKELKAQK